MNKNATKRSLLASVMALVLCVAMLVGTTFAWFTDTASTAVNKIQSGNLKIELQYATEWDSVTGEPTEWKNAEGETLQFKKAAGASATEAVLWEPGCRYALPELHIVNKGNLALKYEIRITGIAGDAKLNEVIDWEYSQWTLSESGYEEALGDSLSSGGGICGTMIPDENGNVTDPILIQGHMQETAGNEYQGLSIDGISITVFATQYTAESDSFDNTYDEAAFDAMAELYPISTTVPVSATGDTTVDKDTIKMTIPADAIAADATGITVSVNKSADVDANFGVAASGMALQQFDVKVSGLKAGNTTPVTVQMFIGKGYGFTNIEVKHLIGGAVETLAGTYDAATGFVTFATASFSPFAVEVPDMPVVSGEGLDTCFYADLAAAFNKVQNGTVKLLKNVSASQKVAVPENNQVTLDLNGKTFTTGASIGIEVKKNAELTVQNGTILSTTDADYSYAIQNYGTLTVNSGRILVTGPKCTCVANNSTLYINGGELNAKNGKAWLSVSNTKATTKITDGAFVGGTYGAYITAKPLNMSITGGTFSDNGLSGYCDEGYAMILGDSGMYVCDKGAPAGYVENGNTITVSTADALRYVATCVNRFGVSYASKTVVLAQDIDLSGNNWEPIGYYDGNSSRQFKGVFDGNGHTVKNMTVVSGNTKGIGFFGRTDSAVVKNLTVQGNVMADLASYVGGIIGHGSGTVANCTFQGTISGACTQVGGIVGSGSFTVTDCKVNGDISGATWVGGIVGNLQKDSGAYTNCTVIGSVTARLTSSDSNIFAGGIAAAVNEASQVITGCYCDATVKVGDTEVNSPVIDSYNGVGINASTLLHIDGNSWNLEKNGNTSFPVRDSGVEINGMTIARADLSK